jgi:hypothetical protein
LSEEAEGLNRKLNKLKMACYYCNVRLSPNVVNDVCEANSGGEGQVPKNEKVQKVPPLTYNRNGRHFFSKLVESDNDEH